MCLAKLLDVLSRPSSKRVLCGPGHGADNDTYSKGISWDNPTPKEAFTRADSPLWWDAVNSEMASLLAKNVYEEVQEADLPMNYRPLPSRLILKIKRDLKGNIDKYKCRLVAKGYQQVLGRDYDEVFAPTVETATLRTVLADMVERDAYAGQFDVSTAFLNGDLTEVVYLRLLKELGGGIWRLRKALYGLKQAARAWHLTLRKVMEELGYRVSGVDPCLFLLQSTISLQFNQLGQRHKLQSYALVNICPLFPQCTHHGHLIAEFWEG
jgi:hypothetical protein